MEFTKKEVETIKAAIKSRNKSRFIQPFLLVILIIAILAMIQGLMSGDNFAFIAIFLVVMAIVQPQLGGGPKYIELVDILENQLPKTSTMEDVLSQELKKT